MAKINYPAEVKEHWAESFNKELAAWIRREKKEGRKVSQTYLADYLGVSETTIHNWKTGEHIPSDETIKVIAYLFHIEPEKLSSHEKWKHDIQYRYSVDFQKNALDKNEKKAVQKYGLDLGLLQSIQRLLGSEYDESFPLTSPCYMTMDEVNDEEGRFLHWDHQYKRRPFNPAADVRDPSDKKAPHTLLQVKKENDTITLSEYDMNYLRALQKDLTTFIKDHFRRHTEQLEADRIAINEALQAAIEDAARTGRVIQDFDYLTQEQKEDLDPWGIGLNKKNGGK